MSCNPKESRFRQAMEWLAQATTNWVGSSWAFAAAVLLTLTWLTSGLLVSPRFNDTWQLVMNTISSVVTFLMVFLLQRSQNKEMMAEQIKLNEILAALKGASKRLINVEDLSEENVRLLHERYQKLADQACGRGNVNGRTSIENVREVAGG
jgi:low affinity Fe/Cu permease